MSLQSHLQIKPHTRTRTRRLKACYRHPSEPVTGFCALCLRERLAGLQPEPETSSSAITGGATGNKSSLSTLAPELRRSKSVSASKCEASSSFSEPRRMSCDVKVRSSLSNLFNLDDDCKGLDGDVKVESNNLGGLSRISGEENHFGDEIRVSEAVRSSNLNVELEIGENLKTMKEHIDLELQTKKETLKDLKDIAGNLASVFTKKLQRWRHKQVKKRSAGNDKGPTRGDLLTMRINGLIGRELRETESEIGEYRLGRRSCDTEPRFSVDAGRMSVEASRISFDEPRASWDGYLIARTIPRLTPMLSVVEDAMLATVNKQIEDDQMQAIIEDESTSGGSGSAHTNSDSSSSQRRSSFDRSSSVRSCNKKLTGLESDELKLAKGAKDSPAKLVITEKELKDWRLSTLRDEQSQRLERVRKNVTPVPSGSTPNRIMKSSRWRKVCSKWGLVHKPDDNNTYPSFASMKDCNPVAEACEKEQEQAKQANPTVKFSRSSSCVGSRDSLMESSTKNVAEASGLKGGEDFMLERNRSTGYSPSDSGLLRFYLTPFRSYSYRRSKSGKTKPRESASISRNAVRLN